MLGAAALSLLPAAAPAAFARRTSSHDDGVRLAGGEFLTAAAVLAVVSARGVARESVRDARAATVSRPAARGEEVAALNNMTPSAGGKQLVMMLGLPRETCGNLLHQQITPN